MPPLEFTIGVIVVGLIALAFVIWANPAKRGGR